VFPHAFTDANQLITHPEADLVIVLPPAPQHAAFVRPAIAAGKTSTASASDHQYRGYREFAGSRRDESELRPALCYFARFQTV
jgi:hypothetical protein